MKFIHCSDIHLNSKMETNFSPAQARERNAEILATFSRMAEYAKKEGVRAVLIAGDLFDSGRATSVTADYVLSVITQAKGIDFLYLKGNHEGGASPLAGRILPENLKTFSPDRWTTYDYGPVAVTGAEITDGSAFDIYDSLSLNLDKTNIVMLHGEASGRRGRDLISFPDLKGKHIDYLALGHFHSFECGALDDSGSWCYSGALEGRGFDECGSKGFVLLSTEGRQVRHEFIPFAKRTFYDIPVDITGLVTISELETAMLSAASQISSENPVKFTLQGTYTPKTQKDFPFLLKLLEPRFYFVKIKDESRLFIEKGSYENDISLKGEFIRTVLDSGLASADKELVISCGLQALSGEKVEL